MNWARWHIHVILAMHYVCGGGLGVQGQLELQNEFQARPLHSKIVCLSLCVCVSFAK